MNKPLNKALHDHLNQYQLSFEQIDTLRALDINGNQKSCAISRRTGVSSKWGYVAAASLFVVALVFAGQAYLTYQNTAMVAAIVKEVTANHAKLKPLEVTGNQLDSVARYFNQLDFVPRNSAIDIHLEQLLIGGRYCSIQGHTAAQLRIQNQSGTLSTLFETKYDPDTFKMIPNLDEGQAPLVKFMNGYRVQLWVEKGIVMALVEPAE